MTTTTTHIVTLFGSPPKAEICLLIHLNPSRSTTEDQRRKPGKYEVQRTIVKTDVAYPGVFNLLPTKESERCANEVSKLPPTARTLLSAHRSRDSSS